MPPCWVNLPSSNECFLNNKQINLKMNDLVLDNRGALVGLRVAVWDLYIFRIHVEHTVPCGGIGSAPRDSNFSQNLCLKLKTLRCFV